MPKGIIFYTDCFTFGGCEKAIYEIMSCGTFKQKYDYYFVYRSSKEYKKSSAKFYPEINQSRKKEVSFWDLNSWYFSLEQAIPNAYFLAIIKKFASLLFRILMPLIFFYEYLYLYFLFSNLKADTVHINNGGYPGALGCRAAAVAAKSAGKKHIILGVHNLAEKDKGIFNKIIDFLVRRSVSAVITVSQASALTLHANRGFAKEILRTIYLGVKDQAAVKNSAPDTRRICMVGRFEERKGHRLALLALQRLIKLYPECADLKLIFLGEGLLLKEMRALALKEGIEKNVEFLGHRNDCLNYIASSLFLLNPSLEFESLPYSILEAMSAGVPVIGTDVGGIPEEIESAVSGIIVPPGDAKALSEAMLALLSDETKRLRMGEEARKRFAEKFTLEGMIGNYLEFYSSLN